MTTNLTTFSLFPRNVMNIALDATPRSTFTNLPALVPDPGTPTSQVSTTAPAKLSTDARIGHTLQIGASATAGALWCGNWDVSALDSTLELQQITLPPLFVRWPNIFGAGAVVMQFAVARYTGLIDTPFKLLGSPLSVRPTASVSGEYGTTGPVTFDWKTIAAASGLPTNDPLYFNSPEFLATLGFVCQATITNYGPTAFNAYVDLGFNRDESNVTADPIAGWGTAGIQIQAVPRRRRGAMV